VQANGGTGCFAVSGGGVQSIAVAQPAPEPNNIVISDALGNGDGNLDAGEQASLIVVLRNSGLGNLTNVTGTLRAVTSGISIINPGPFPYSNIPPNALAGPTQHFGIALDADGSLCGTVAQFVLDVTSDQGCFAIPVSVALDDSECSVFEDAYARPGKIYIASDTLNTCGDGDGGADPGEMVQVKVDVQNVGDQTASGVVVRLFSDKPYFSIVSDTVNLGSLIAGRSATATFVVSVGNAPFADQATLSATVTWSGHDPVTLDATTTVNRDLVTTTHNATFDSSNDGWMPEGLWAREMAPTTGDLTTVFHSGYTADQCDTLTSSEVEFSATSSMSFDLAYVSEGTPAEGFLDGLDIQITLDGGRSWNTLPVTQGYAGISASTSCVGSGLPIFSGVSPLMKRYDADLSAYAGRKGQIRFRFGSDPLVEAQPAGAWVDNVTTSNIIVSVPDTSCQ